MTEHCDLSEQVKICAAFKIERAIGIEPMHFHAYVTAKILSQLQRERQNRCD